MINIFLKLVSESLLSLYPVFIKKIPTSLDNQLLSRMIGYAVIPIFFMSMAELKQNLLTREVMTLSMITFVHILYSYKGFQNLDSGIAYTIFYMYPILLIFWENKTFSPFYLVTLLGLILVSVDLKNPKKDLENLTKVKGIFYLFIALITEVMIYYAVKNIKGKNQWNSLFYSYFPALVIYSIYYYLRIYKKKDDNVEEDTQKSKYLIYGIIAFNIIVGLAGYYLRFYTIKKLPTKLYSVLSYFGIIMSYVYGVVLEGQKITIQQVIGTLLIIYSNYCFL